MPLIDIGIDRITELIKSVINPRFEDSIQEAWVRILDDHVGSEEDVLRIAHSVNHEYASKTIGEQHKLQSLQKPIYEGKDGGIFTLEDMLGNEDIALRDFQNDYEPETVPRIYQVSQTPLTRFLISLLKDGKGHWGNCVLCKHMGVLDNRNLCQSCSDLWVDSRQIQQKVYYLNHTEYYRNYRRGYWPIQYKKRVESGLCLRCSNPAIEGHRFCNIHLLKHREHGRDYGRKRYAYRKENHLCSECGMPLFDSKSRCGKCLARRREAKHKLYPLKPRIIDTILPQMIRLAEEGRNLYEISRILHCGKNTPYRHKAEIIKALEGKQISVPPPWRQPTKRVIPFSQKFPRIIAMLKEGYAETAITKELHLGHSAFYRHRAEIDKALEKEKSKVPRFSRRFEALVLD